MRNISHKPLIIKAELSNPPTEALAFRTLTMLARSNLSLHSIVEVEDCFKDMYYHYLKVKCLMDFVDQLITPEENEAGIRIGVVTSKNQSINIDRITFQNLFWLLGILSSS